MAKKMLNSNTTVEQSESNTENFFREFYGVNTFIEKSAIPSYYGFKSKDLTNNKGYPDFFRDGDYAIVVEAKAVDHKAAQEEVQFYMQVNNLKKDIVGIAISGQDKSNLNITYYFKDYSTGEIKEFDVKNTFVSLVNIKKNVNICKYGNAVSEEELLKFLKELNKRFHNENKVRDTDRSLFFSGLLIALTNNEFRKEYAGKVPPSPEEISTTQTTVLEAHNLNNAIIDAITKQLSSKINNLSKEFNWKDRFSFIRNIDYPLEEYKSIIKDIEEKIYNPFIQEERLDILGKAYKIFLSRAGSIDNKNIILTPDHIKVLMVKLARLTKDDVVLDTCTGSGGFLMEAMETMIELSKGDFDKIKEIKEQQLIGFEIDSVLFALACSNMFLHGDGKTNLLYRSSLLNQSDAGIMNNRDQDLFNYIKKLKPTKVIINPPYENNNSIKFVNQAIDYLEPLGKLIIIMPTPTLVQNQGGITDVVLSKAKLDFVIKMPNNLFSEQKRIVNTSIFGFTKTPHQQDDDVLFYKLLDDGFESIQHKGKVDKYHKWDTIEAQVIDCIKNTKELPDVCQKRKIYSNGILNCAGVQPSNENEDIVKISDLFDIEDGTLASSDNVNGLYDFITASEVWKTHNKYTHDKEAIIMATKASGSLGRTHYVNGKFIVSNLCVILTPKKESKYPVNLIFYNKYFEKIREAFVSDLADGSSKLTISKPSLANYYIKYYPIQVQEEIALKIEQLDLLNKKYQLEKEKLAKKIDDIL